MAKNSSSSVLTILVIIASVLVLIGYFVFENIIKVNQDSKFDYTQTLGEERTFSYPTPVVRYTPVPYTLQPQSTPVSTPPLQSSEGDFWCGEDGVIPATGPAPLLVDFWPTGGMYPTSTSGSSILGYQFDFEGDGVWDSDVVNYDQNESKIISYTYEKNGIFQPKFRILGSRGDWSKTCLYPYKIFVGCNKCWKNDDLVVDKTFFLDTISKSFANTEMVRKDRGNPVNGLNYGTGIYIGLKEDASIRLTRIDLGGMDHGLFEISIQTSSAGRGFKIHSFINPKLSNGDYSGSYLLEYLSAEDGYWEQGPVIDYTIRVVD